LFFFCKIAATRHPKHLKLLGCQFFGISAVVCMYARLPSLRAMPN